MLDQPLTSAHTEDADEVVQLRARVAQLELTVADREAHWGSQVRDMQRHHALELEAQHQDAQNQRAQECRAAWEDGK